MGSLIESSGRHVLKLMLQQRKQAQVLARADSLTAAIMLVLVVKFSVLSFIHEMSSSINVSHNYKSIFFVPLDLHSVF